MTHRHIVQSVLIVMVTAGIMTGIRMVYDNIIVAGNHTHLQELANRSIYRVELATDLAVSTLAVLQTQGHTTCTPQTLAAFRKYVMTVGSLKNIMLHSPRTSCAVFGTNSLPKDMRSAHKWETSRNPSISLSVRSNGHDHTLLIRWKNKDRILTAVISTGGMLYDMVPDALRAHLHMGISLKAGQEIAAYHPQSAGYDGKNEQHKQTNFVAHSKRYPIKARLSIDENRLLTWNRSNSLTLDLLGLCIGLFIGFLAAGALLPPLGPIDELDEAIANGEIVPFFQPIIHLRSSEICGFEMLARWIKPDGTMVPADRFIVLAENFGRIDAVLFALLRSAGLSIGKELRANPHLKLSFNITPEQFLDPEFLPRLLGVIGLVNLPPNCLVAEITERQQIADLETASELILRYREHGIRIAIDDAGTGHNGLSSIQKLDVSMIKLDKFFIDGIVESRRARQMIEMLANLARQYGMTVVAEGIETPEQALAAQAMGVAEGQGFYFSRPLPARELLDLLAEQRKPLTQNNTKKSSNQHVAIRIAS